MQVEMAATSETTGGGSSSGNDDGPGVIPGKLSTTERVMKSEYILRFVEV